MLVSAGSSIIHLLVGLKQQSAFCRIIIVECKVAGNVNRIICVRAGNPAHLRARNTFKGVRINLRHVILTLFRSRNNQQGFILIYTVIPGRIIRINFENDILSLRYSLNLHLNYIHCVVKCVIEPLGSIFIYSEVEESISLERNIAKTDIGPRVFR